jgi:hypothetical protein
MFSGRSVRETLEPDLEPLWVRAVGRATRHRDVALVKALQPRLKHRPVDLAQQTAGDVHDALRIDAEQVAVEREVMDRAQREAVDNRSDSAGLGVRHDVRGLNEDRKSAPGHVREDRMRIR